MFSRDGPLLLPLQLFNDLWIIPQIHLRADKEAGYPGAMVPNFREPPLLHVLERGGGGDAEADEEDIRLWVRKWTQTIVIFLTY